MSNLKDAKLIKLFMIVRPLIRLRQTVETTLRGMTNISKSFVTFFTETMEMYLSISIRHIFLTIKTCKRGLFCTLQYG